MINSVHLCTGGYNAITNSDENGMYSFRSLPPGVYKIKAAYPSEIVARLENYAVSPALVHHLFSLNSVQGKVVTGTGT